jgi:uncharacterized BrkB/YihY/UPF0761 family membrane protein
MPFICLQLLLSLKSAILNVSTNQRFLTWNATGLLIPLVPIVFVIMGIFTSLVFWKKDKVQSRSLLGFGAVMTVLLSIMSGYGLQFLIGK